MPRKGITFDQVSNAAAAVKARGVEPTIYAVRVELGNEGSYSTISPLLARWKTETAAHVALSDLPEAAEQAGMTAITTIWNVAVKLANEEKAAMRQDHEDTKKRLSEELTEARTEIAELEKAMSQMGDELTKAQKTASDETAKKLTVQGELTAQHRLYQELLKSIKQPTAKGQPTDTKSERPASLAAVPGKTQAAAQ